MQIVIDSNVPYIKDAFIDVADVHNTHYQQITNAAIKNADALIVRTRTVCNADLLHDTKVKFIATATIGFDHIDTQYCDNQEIKWTNAPACNALAVAQYIASVFCFLIRKKKLVPAQTVVGIVGVGAVGTRVEMLAKSLGFSILLNDPPRERKEGKGDFVSLDEICVKADIITFHTPLTEQGTDRTFHLADERFLKMLQRKPVIINTARGEIVDTKAFTNQKNGDCFADLIVDCWENEPQIDRELLNRATLATPHIAGYSADGKLNATVFCVNAVKKFLGIKNNGWQPQQSVNMLEISDLSKTNPTDFYLQTYDIEQDSNALKANPAQFENLRVQYCFRREPKAYFPLLSEEMKNKLGDFWTK